jgi:hypothetical protein
MIYFILILMSIGILSMLWGLLPLSEFSPHPLQFLGIVLGFIGQALGLLFVIGLI